MIELSTDGACSGNPGRGGWAFSILRIIVNGGSSHIIARDSGGEEHTTNNRAEMLAVIRGLEYIQKWRDDTGDRDNILIQVRTDSNLVVQSMAGTWQKKANRDLWYQLERLNSLLPIQWVWTPRNSTSELEWCDATAKKMAQLAVALPNSSTNERPIDMSSQLGLLQKEIHQVAREKGWWPEGTGTRNVGEIFANFHSEISEAWEIWRDGISPKEVWTNPQSDPPDKPEGVGIELADTIIRILDYAESLGLDMHSLVVKKMEYNKKRPLRHGGKLA